MGYIGNRGGVEGHLGFVTIQDAEHCCVHGDVKCWRAAPTALPTMMRRSPCGRHNDHPKYFKTIHMWWSWLFGGCYKVPGRGQGWMPSLWFRTKRWKTDMGRGYTWWKFVRPPRKWKSSITEVSQEQRLALGARARKVMDVNL